MLGHQSRRSIAWLISLSASRHNQNRASIVKAAVDSMDGLVSMPQRIAVDRQAIQIPGLQPRHHHGELSDIRAVDWAYLRFRAWPVQHTAIARQADPSILASYAAQYSCNQGPPCFAPYWKKNLTSNCKFDSLARCFDMEAGAHTASLFRKPQAHK